MNGTGEKEIGVVQVFWTMVLGCFFGVCGSVEIDDVDALEVAADQVARGNPSPQVGA